MMKNYTVMKKELVKYVMEKADKEFNDDFPIGDIEIWIDEFFENFENK